MRYREIVSDDNIDQQVKNFNIKSIAKEVGCTPQHLYMAVREGKPVSKKLYNEVKNVVNRKIKENSKDSR